VSEMPVIGNIEGITSTDRFSITISDERVGKNDYLEVNHEGKRYLVMIKEVKRVGEKSTGLCIVIGASPKTPFKPGADVVIASDEVIRKNLGLETSEAAGIYVGKLGNSDVDIWLAVSKLTRIFIVGKPGSGKSYSMGVIAEELIKKGIPLIIVDAHGEYSSLKVPASSKPDAFHVTPRGYAENILEFAASEFNQGADIDISALDEARPEDLVAQMQCTIINLRGLDIATQYKHVSKLLSKLLEAVMTMRIPPFFLALDEAHLFAGRTKQEDRNAKSTLEAVRRFSQEGRKFGANMIVLTQRPQLLDMTVRSLSATWFIHKLTDPNDVRIAIESGGLDREWESEITWLEPGQAIITGDVIEKVPLIVKVRPRETRHGAPGFNPMDYVSPKERERMKRRMADLKQKLLKLQPAPDAPPAIPNTLPALYLPILVDESAIINDLKENKSMDAIELLKSSLTYVPSLFCDVSINSVRKSPPLAFKDRFMRLIPAGASAMAIDWRQESAYGLEPSDIIKNPPSPSPSRSGNYEAISSSISDASTIEDTKGRLKSYAASKATQAIFMNGSLGEHSKPGESAENFRRRLKEIADGKLAARAAEIRSSYESRLKEVSSKIKMSKDELEGIENLRRQIEAELKAIEKEKAAAERQGRSTLKLSNQIQTRQSRLTRLEGRITELKDKIIALRKDEVALNNSMKKDLEAASREMESLIDAPLQTITFQPKTSEIEIDALQLIWVPVFEASFRAFFQGSTRDYSFSWNGVTGAGSLGSCSKCGTSVESRNGKIFCCTCGKIYCDEHLETCKTCSRYMCEDHAWRCPSCGNFFCIDEKLKSCAECGKLMCSECAVSCELCDGKAYCSEHVKTCETCGKKYCAEHYGSHMAKCAKCNKETCIIEQKKCSICGKIFCKEHVFKCKACGETVCEKDSWGCDICGERFCDNEPQSACKVCKKTLCRGCTEICAVCGAHLCKDHATACAGCGKLVCSDCLIEKRRLGLFKKLICKECAAK